MALVEAPNTLFPRGPRVSAPTLHCPDFRVPWSLSTDATRRVEAQIDEDHRLGLEPRRPLR